MVERPPISAPMIGDRISTLRRVPLAKGKRTGLENAVKTKPTPSPTRLLRTAPSSNRLAGNANEAIWFIELFVDGVMEISVK